MVLSEDLLSNFDKLDLELSPQKADDPRIGHLLGRQLKDWKAPRVAFLGYPSDEGIRINGGRIGASFAPDIIRESLYRLTPDVRNCPASISLIEESVDLGNLRLSENVEADQELLGSVVSELIDHDTIPVILGGGHDLSFGHFLGYCNSDRDVSILNFDSHPDVREVVDGRAHSGSPFRQALTHKSKRCTKYSVFGVEPYAICEAHLNFLEEKGCACFFMDDLRQEHIEQVMTDLSDDCMVTFDIDVLSQGIAPGVSARVRGHMPLETWNFAAFSAGKNEHVHSFDIVECNPKYDNDHATSRLAAQTIWHFLRGVALRQRH